MGKMKKLIFLLPLLLLALQISGDIDYGSRYFDGDDYITEIPTNGFDWDDTSWTIEFKFKLAADQAHSFFSIYEGNGASGFLVDFNNHVANAFTCQVFTVDNPQSNTWTMDFDWHHLAFVCTGTEYYFYLDGENIGSDGGSFAPVEPASLEFTLGCRNFNDGFIQHMDGYLDEIRYWNYGRTQQQIEGSIDKVTADEEPGLIVYLPMDEKSGNVFDKSGNANHSVTVSGTSSASNAPIRRIIGD
jgi:hypothetical protein